MADESLAAGHTKDGATALISVLAQRIELYFVRYPDVTRGR